MPLCRLSIAACTFAGMILIMPVCGAFAASNNAVANDLIVRLAPECSPNERSELVRSVGVRVVHRFKLVPFERWRVRGGTRDDVIERLEGDPRVLSISVNQPIQLDAVVPNDPMLGEMWGLHNNGELSGVAGADIDALRAWQIATGTDVLVAIIDTGIDYNHEDLAANIWTNEDEVPDNGIDDDGNGYIDDVHGWDFSDNDNDPFDAVGHGTHVAGTVGAVGNNGIGITGVCWSARLMPVKIFSDDGSGSIAAAAQGIEYATLMGARVSNNSWSASGFGPEYDLLQQMMIAAHDAGHIIVTSAGNSRLNTDYFLAYPQSYDLDNIIAVANLADNDQMHASSSFGKVTVDLGAPGTSILSCMPGNHYDRLTGTSMASPHVAGAVALVWSFAPHLSYTEVINLILSSVDPVNDLAPWSTTGGRLNVYRALQMLDATPPAAIGTLAATAGVSSVTASWTSPGETGGAARYELRYAAYPLDDTNFGSAQTVWGVPTPKPAGALEQAVIDGLDVGTPYYFGLVVYDSTDNASPLSNVVQATPVAPSPAPSANISTTPIATTLATGETDTTVVAITNNGTVPLDWRMSLSPGMHTPAGYQTTPPEVFDPDRVPYRGDLLVGVTIMFDLAHGQVQDRWMSIIMELERRGANMIYNSAAMSPATFAGVDILWLTDAHTPAQFLDAEIDAMCGWLWSGGGLLMEADDPLTIGGLNRILTALAGGIGYIPGNGAEGATPNIVPHPIVSGVTALRLHRNTARLGPAQSPAIVIVRDTNGDAAVAAIVAGSGRVVAMSDELFDDDRIETSWPNDEDSALLAVNVFDWLSRPEWLRTDRGGTVAPNTTFQLPLVFDSATLPSGTHQRSLVLHTNDPLASTVSIPVSIDVTGAPDATVSANAMDFGIVFTGYPVERSVIVANEGSSDLILWPIETSDAAYTAEANGIVIKPGQMRGLALTCTANGAANLDAELTLNTNDPDRPTITVALFAAGLDPPVISVSPLSLDEALYSDETRPVTVVVENQGASELLVDVIPTPPSGASRVTTESVQHFGLDDIPPTRARPRPPTNHDTKAGVVVNPLLTEDFEDGDFNGWDDLGAGMKAVTSSVAANLSHYSYTEWASPPGHGNGIAISLPDQKPGRIGFHVRAAAVDKHAGYFVLRQPDGAAILYSYLNAGAQIAVNAGSVGEDRSRIYEANRWYWIEFKNIDYDARTFDYYLDKNLIRTGMQFLGGATGDGIGLVELYSYSDGAQAWWDEIEFTAGDQWLAVSPTNLTIPAGGSALVDVLFDATEQVTGTQFLDITFSSNDPDNPSLAVPVSLAVTGVPNLEVLTPSLDFGAVVIGRTATLPVDLFNLGFEHDVIVQNIATGEVTGPGATLTPRQERTINVSFAPTSAGLVADSLLIVSNDRDAPIMKLAYTGEGLTAPIIAVTPDSLSASLNNGDADQQLITIENPAPLDAVDLEWTLSIGYGTGSGWIVPSSAAGTVPPGQIDSVVVTLDGDRFAGHYDAAIAIAHNVPAVDPVDIPVDMWVAGTPVISVADSLHVGESYLGFPKASSLRVFNTGTDTLFISSASADQSVFQVSPGSLSVPPSGVDTLVVTYTPVSVVADTATLSIASNDTTNAVTAVVLTGSGLGAPIADITPDSLQVSIVQGGATTSSLRIRNTGTSTLNWQADMAFDVPLSKTSPPRSTSQAGSLVDVLFHGDHFFGFALWSTAAGDVAALGGTITQSNDPITPQLLADYDILWLGDISAAYSSAENQAIGDWVNNGGGLLLEADNDVARSSYNALLQTLGSGITIFAHLGQTTLANTDPHETTAGITTVKLLAATARVNVALSAGSILRESGVTPIGAHDAAGKGRIIVICDQVFSDLTIFNNDNRPFLGRILGWLSGTLWADMPVISGSVPAQDSVDVAVDFDHASLPAGTYRVNIDLASNDPLKPLITIPVAMEIIPAAVATSDLPPPKVTSLYQNFPNPFNPATVIRYDIAGEGMVSLEIFDVRGRHVTSWIKPVAPGRYEYRWTGKDRFGNEVASGVYFYRLKAPGYNTTRKMVLLR